MIYNSTSFPYVLPVAHKMSVCAQGLCVCVCACALALCCTSDECVPGGVCCVVSLVDPYAPHADDDYRIAGDEHQVDAEEQEVQDVPHVAPLVHHLARPLQVGDVRANHAHVLADLSELRHSQRQHSRHWGGEHTDTHIRAETETEFGSSYSQRTAVHEFKHWRPQTGPDASLPDKSFRRTLKKDLTNDIFH